MHSQFAQTGGLRWTIAPGVVMNATWPFARITVAAESVEVTFSVLGFFRRTFSFTHQTLQKAQRQWWVLSTGVRLIHSVPDYPPYILFWTFGYRSLAAALRTHGYRVEDQTKA